MNLLAREILRVAKEVLAYGVKDQGGFDRLRHEMTWGDWKYGLVLKGKTHGAVGKVHAKSVQLRPSFDLDEALVKAQAKEVVHAEVAPDMLVVEIVGSIGRTDTYVFTKVPYETLLGPDVKPPAAKVEELRAALAEKMHERGLRNLGERMSKAGEQYGVPGKARRIGLGRAFVMANYLLVEDKSQAGGRRYQGSRWNMYKQWSIKETDDILLDDLVVWVNNAPDMTEVRQWAADDRASKTEEGAYGLATGLKKGGGSARPGWSVREGGFATGLKKAKT